MLFLGSVLAAASFAVCFGGSLWDGLAAAVFGAGICSLQRLLSRTELSPVGANLLISLITGMVVGGMTFRGMFANHRVFGVIFFRMILASGLAVCAAALAARLLPVEQSIVMIPMLGAIAPSASNINQVAILYNKDAQYASAINVLTTLSCLATIPLWVMLFEAIIG